jgi:hypothetical protein
MGQASSPDDKEKKAGGRYAVDLFLQLPAREVRFRCCALRLPFDQ